MLLEPNYITLRRCGGLTHQFLESTQDASGDLLTDIHSQAFVECEYKKTTAAHELAKRFVPSLVILADDHFDHQSNRLNEIVLVPTHLSELLEEVFYSDSVNVQCVKFLRELFSLGKHFSAGVQHIFCLSLGIFLVHDLIFIHVEIIEGTFLHHWNILGYSPS